MKNVQIDTVQTNDFAMDYFWFGQGAQALVILPGLSVENITKHAALVAKSYTTLAKDFTIYVLDRKRDLPETYPVTEMAKDAATAIRTLGLSHIALLGVSLGGMMAMTIAAEHPELVAKLILGSTSPNITPAQYQSCETWIQLAKGKDAATLYRAFADAIYPSHVAEQVRDFLASCAETVTEEELERFVILAEGVKDFDVRDKLKNITCPVLLTGSEDDRVLGAEGTKEIAKRLDKCAGLELFMYDGYGHAAYDTAPDYKKRIRNFLK